mgnify:FL=1
MVKYSKKNNAGLKCFTVPTGKVVCAKKSRFKPYNINKDKRLTTKAKKKMMATRIQQRVRKQKELKDKPKKKKAGSKIVKKLKSKIKVIKAKKVLKKKKINKAIKGAVIKAEVRGGGFFDSDIKKGTTVGSTKNSKIFKLKFIKKNKQIFKKIKMVSGKHIKEKNLYRRLLSGKLGSYSLKELKDIVKNKDVMIAKGTKEKDRLRKKKAILEKYKLALKDKPKKVVDPRNSIGIGFDKDSDARKLTDNMYDFYENYMRGMRTESITPDEFEKRIIKEVGKRRLKKFNL